jgi:hypothetical protein
VHEYRLNSGPDQNPYRVTGFFGTRLWTFTKGTFVSVPRQADIRAMSLSICQPMNHTHAPQSHLMHSTCPSRVCGEEAVKSLFAARNPHPRPAQMPNPAAVTFEKIEQQSDV